MLTRNKSRQRSSVVSDETAASMSPGICRICLKAGGIPIFGDINISTQIMEFGCIEISSIDNLPQHICDACHSLLESAILFRKTAKRSAEILKNTDCSDDDNASVFSEDQDYKDVEKLEDTDSESCIQREYLEYNNTSDSEMDWKCEPESDDESLPNVAQSDPDSQVTTDDKDIEMQLIKVKDEEGANNDIDNELVMIIVSDKDKTTKSSFGCSKCDLTLESENELHNHEKENHHTASVSNQKKCDICSQLVDKSSYKVHIKQHRDKYKKIHNQKYGKVECEVCGKKVNKSYYKFHMKMHGTAKEKAERFIECPICKKSFSTNYFSDHMKRIHDKKQGGKHAEKTKEKESSKVQKLLKCPICDKMVNERIYKEHLGKHGGSKKRYICDQCGKEFKHPSAFKTHTLTHGSELKFQCQFCPYRGLHLGLLKIHVRTHTGDYNYKCTECPAKFITKSNLSKHLQRHLGECNHKCAICNKGFYSKRDVDKHNQTVHLELKNNICEICGKGFGHRDNMMSHQLKVHKREKLTVGKGRMPTYMREEKMKSNELES